MKFKKTPIYRFIKQYPRISSLLAILILIFLFVLPIPWEEKIMLPIRAALIGFIIALGWWYFQIVKGKPGEKK